MSASILVASVKKKGGRVWLDELGRLNAEGVSESQMTELSNSHDLFVALLREQIASKRWENSGKGPRWWRYPEWRWNWPDQTLRPADEWVLKQWLRESGTADRRCSSAVKFLYWDFCEQHGQDVLPAKFLEFLSTASFTVDEGFVNGLVLASDLYSWGEACVPSGIEQDEWVDDADFPASRRLRAG